MTDTEKNLREMLARHHTEYQQHSSNARALRSEEDAEAAIEAQLALAASNAMQAIAVLIAREPAA